METLDEVIARLQDLRTKMPGDSRVVLSQHGRLEEIDCVGIHRVGVGNKYKFVSRGGVPVVTIFTR